MALVEAQPAYKIYAFDRGWRIIRYVTENLFKRTDIAARWWFNKKNDVLVWGTLKGTFIKYWCYVIVVGMVIAGCIQYIMAMLMAVLFVIVQSLLLSLWAALSLLIIGLLFVGTFIYSRFYRIFFRCTDCHKEMDIPTFICPACATKHTRLWPSVYGIFAHRCKTCETPLPTQRLTIPGLPAMTKRDKLVRICPHCGTQMNADIGTGTNVHIPIIGGPSAGKSNYIVMATKGFKELYESVYHYSIAFTDTKHEQDYRESVYRLSSGRELVKTPQVIAHAFNLKIQAPRAQVPKLAYIYDVAGEAYNTSENTQMQEYYKYINGIVFVIDPFAIADYVYSHQVDVMRYQALIRPSSLDVMHAYERMFQMFENSVGLRRGRRFPHPIAIVITKVDALNLEQEIGSNAARTLIAQNAASSEEEAINTLVRSFLMRYGLDHFVRDVEMQFSRVRYFSCSALGRMPDPVDSRTFLPVRVIEPLLWLLSSAKAIPPMKKVEATLPMPQVMPPQQMT
ncbi:MAG: hypothetical protein ABI456_24215 [Ktedonobacteraceae bacterium]